MISRPTGPSLETAWKNVYSASASWARLRIVVSALMSSTRLNGSGS